MKTKKSISVLISTLLVIALLFSTGLVVLAEDAVTYSYDSTTCTLEIIGSGAMTDYTESNLSSVPWSSYKSQIKKIIVHEGITHIGDYAFEHENSLIEVSLPDSLESIGTSAFAGSDTLLELTVPDSVTSIGNYAFGYNYKMYLTEGFITHCSYNSTAQKYCLENYIPFDAPFPESGQAVVNSTGSNDIYAMWSYVAKADGVLTFYTTGIDSGSEDTYGSVYDADDYTYSTNVYTTMSASAIASNDDQGSNVNFKITCSVEKGKRYYLSSIMRNPKRVGSFMTYVSFACTTHEYTENIITKPNCAQTGEAEYVCSVCGDSYKQVLDKTSEHDYALVDFNDALAGIECSRCNERYTISFMDYLDKQNDFLDVNGDSIVNAKDYALLKQMNK